MIYIATFYSHFGAVHFKKICESKKLPAKMMPVPRNLSSSCGTCVQYVSDTACPCEIFPEEMEQVVCVTENGYETVYRVENS
ncbi:MAG: DUF3343 domain-containing protein [Lachnospiraceae bacterium]|nr:DUF3343 domain-containing protein [Lachnospiraceae bacterium]